MDKGRHTARIGFCLVAMVIISVPQGVISLPCNGGPPNGPTASGIDSQAPGNARSGPARPVPAVDVPTPTAIKKDLFMSRGWGASGMPFSMFYLNHYTKAQKAYTESQVQQQQLQQQQQQLQQQQVQLQLQAQQKLQEVQRIQQQPRRPDEPLLGRSDEDATNPISDRPLVPKTVPLGSRYEAEPVAIHAQQLRTDTDYVDSSPSVRTTSKVNTARRQYTVPQLFVSYGWGPMG